MSDIFQLADVAKITGLALNKIQQWTLGRPYKIRASVRLSSKRGVPKLFNADDVLKFIVVKQLTQDGFMSRIIQSALLALKPHTLTLSITKGRAHSVDIRAIDLVAKTELYNKNVSVCVLDVAQLRTELSEKIAAAIHSRERIGRAR
jgi:hypothetical protein